MNTFQEWRLTRNPVQRLEKLYEYKSRLLWVASKRNLLNSQQKLDLEIQQDSLEILIEKLEREVISWELNVNIEDI